MIKNILIPEKIKSYYLFPQRILGFDISRSHISVTQLLVKGTTVTIEKIITHTLPSGTAADYAERVSKEITILLGLVDRYDAIHTALSSSFIIYKDLSLPFSGKEKISKVIDYEVEPLLPFPTDQAVIDFIVTKSTPETTEILIAAAQKVSIAEHISYFETAGVSPDQITVDLFALYGAYNMIPSYQQFSGATALIDIGFSTTNIAYIVQGQLKAIRTLQKGINLITKTMATDLQLQSQDIIDDLMRFGLEKEEDAAYTTAVTHAIGQFSHDLQFTLQSFAMKTQTTTQRLLILGTGGQIRGLPEVLHTQFSVATSLFSLDELINQKKIVLKEKNGISSTDLVSVCTALPNPTTEDFSLRKKEFSLQTTSLFTKQIIVGFTLLVTLFVILLGNSFKQVSKLTTASTQAEKQTRSLLQQTLDIPGSRSLDDMVEEARRKVDDQERIWSAFLRHRSSFLTYLQKLSSRIDKQALGLKLKELAFTPGIIKLQGEVKNIDAVKLLEEQLAQTNLGHVSAAEEPKFTITITLKKTEED